MIDTKLLRQKILDLAIRGKLVRQDPNDEPASELLKKIKAEKETLIKAGNLKRDKHESFIFRGDDKRYYEQIDGKTTDITKEIPFDLPEGWAWCRLHNLCKSIIDGDHQPPPQTSEGIPFLVISNVSDGKLSFQHTRFVSEEYFSGLSESRIPHRDDILLTVTGSYGIAILIEVETKFCFQRHISLLKTINTNNHFLTRWLQTEPIKKQFDKSVTGTAQQTLGLNVLRTTLLPLPPLAEQKRIVAQIERLLKCVDEIDKESETLEKSITLAKQKILDLAIRGKLVPQDPDDEPASELLKKIKAEKETQIKAGKLKRDKHESFIFRGDDNCYYEQLNGKSVKITAEIPFDLPDGWVWSRLRSLGTIVGGGTPSTLNADYWNGEIPWLSPADLTDYHKKYISRGRKNITTDGLAHSSAVLMPSGSILYSSRAPIGYVVIARNAISTNQGFKSLVPAINGLSEFLYYILIGVTPDIKRRATGTTFKEISGAEFGETLVPLPPLREQLRIVQAIEQYDSILGAISK